MKRIKSSKPSMREKNVGLSRREFAARGTLAAAAIAANPGAILAATAVPAAIAAPLLQETPGDKPKLSPEALGEVEAKVAEIFRRYGSRLSDEQKADVRRLMRDAQVQIEALRAFRMENSDEPATILHLIGPPARHAPPPPAATPAGKKPAGGGA